MKTNHHLTAAITLILLFGVGCTRGTSSSAPQMTEAMPTIQAHVLHTGDSSAPTFLLPEANQNFVGTWGGHVSVDPSQTSWSESR